jgi:hypothetical protein
VLRDNLEVVLGWDSDRVDHRPVDDVSEPIHVFLVKSPSSYSRLTAPDAWRRAKAGCRRRPVWLAVHIRCICRLPAVVKEHGTVGGRRMTSKSSVERNRDHGTMRASVRRTSSIRLKRATATVESRKHPPVAPMVAVPLVPSFHAPGAGRQAGLARDLGG